MENEINSRLTGLEEKTEKIFESVEKTRKYFLVIMWVTLAAVVLPLIGLMFAIPTLMDSYSTSIDLLL